RTSPSRTAAPPPASSCARPTPGRRRAWRSPPSTGTRAAASSPPSPRRSPRSHRDATPRGGSGSSLPSPPSPPPRSTSAAASAPRPSADPRRRPMRTRSLLVALLALVVVSSAACGDDDSGGGSGDLDAVEVVLGSDGEPPTFEFDQPFAVTETVKRVLEAGDGDAAADGSAVIFHFVFVNGRDGSEGSTSYGLEPATVTVDEALLPGVRIALTGAQAGERSLVAIAPGDAFAGQGDDEETGVREDDTL